MHWYYPIELLRITTSSGESVGEFYTQSFTTRGFTQEVRFHAECPTGKKSWRSRHVQCQCLRIGTCSLTPQYGNCGTWVVTIWTGGDD